MHNLLQARNRHSASFAAFIQDNAMTQFTQNAQDTETTSHHAGIRLAELIDQNWNRNKSAKLAMLESISLSDQHWHVIDYLRTQYLKHGEAAGIVVHQGMTSNVQNSKELHAITTW
jgi:hypothetical protein